MNTTTDMSSSSAQPVEVGGDFDNFCHLLVEDYLRRKNMHGTLKEFKTEWMDRPVEDDCMLSWYEISMKLRLPDLLSVSAGSNTVLENMSHALMRESSMRARQSVQVIAQGLATLPKTKPLPPVLERINATSTNGVLALTNGAASGTNLTGEGKDDGAEDITFHPATTEGGGGASTKGSLITKNSVTPAVAAAMEQKKAKMEASAKLTAETTGKPKFVSRAGQRVVLSAEAEAIVAIELEKKQEEHAKAQARKIKQSQENWIPDLERARSLERDFKVLKDNLTDVQKREMQERREMKQFLVSDLEKARNEESLGKTHRHACGCCLQKYLLLNLPLRVSQKAVLDIRIKWGGKLTSKTVFGGVNPPIGQYLAGTEIDADGTILNPDGTFPNAGSRTLEEINESITSSQAAADPRQKKTYLEKIQERLSRMPRCYSDVPVCTFCSQFFQDQESYRPSFATITYEERKGEHMQRVSSEKEYWDPLKLVEKDREEAIKEEEELLLLQAAEEVDNNTVNNTVGTADDGLIG